jgi:hypothetical protein
MAKKLISVWLSLTVLLFSTITIYAEDDVLGQFLNRNIDINGNRIANYYLDDPFFLYQGATYFPLTEELGEILGFATEMDWESRTLKILKKEPVKTALREEVLKNNLENSTAVVLRDLTVITLAEEMKKLPKLPVTLHGVKLSAADIDIGGQLEQIKAKATADIIEIPKLIVEQLDMTSYEVLQVGDVLYLPIRALTGDSCFGWDVYYDNYSGLYVSTDGEPATSYFDQAESKYNKGLADYIMYRNKEISAGKALMLVFLFKHEAEVNGVDERLLMAIAHKESTFRTDAVGGGAIGLMQIMPRTAELYGIPKSALTDPHVNIEFGAKYIGDKLVYYDDKTIALSAYNQGGAAISRGTYTTRYATRVTDAEGSLENYLLKNGYGLGE